MDRDIKEIKRKKGKIGKRETLRKYKRRNYIKRGREEGSKQEAQKEDNGK